MVLTDNERYEDTIHAPYVKDKEAFLDLSKPLWYNFFR